MDIDIKILQSIVLNALVVAFISKVTSTIEEKIGDKCNKIIDHVTSPSSVTS